MNVIELFILLAVTASAANLVIFRRAKLRLLLPGAAVFFSIVNLLLNGFRMQMTPVYLLAGLLLIMEIIRKLIGLPKGKKIIKLPLIVLLALTLIIAIALPVLLPVVRMPEPGGSYHVGTMYMSFTDASRKGIFTAADQSREIAVQVWYPSDDVTGKKVLNFAVNSKISSYMAERLNLPNLFDQLTKVKTHSYLDATLSDKESSYPVILFSSGYGSFVGQNTVQMEELASNGYIVFSVSHPYEDFASIYPDGEVLHFSVSQVSRFQKELTSVSKSYTGDKGSVAFERYAIKNCKIAYESVQIWSDDTSFIADELDKLNQGEISSIFKNKLDTKNMGVFGHSFGGATAGQTCLKDDRFKAFINMDGTAFGDNINQVISQPFMIMNSDSDKELIKAGYSSKQTNYTVVTINGAKHADFMDFTVLLPSFRYLGMLGDIGGSRQEAIMNDYVLAFFNKYLKGTTEPLIEGELQKYEEVTIEHK